MADVPATDLTPETSATLSGAEQFVMFDAVEGKRCTVDDLFVFQRVQKGSMGYKTIRCNNLTEITVTDGCRFKKEVAWPNMKASDYIAAFITAGSYNGFWAAEGKDGSVELTFATEPASSVYVTVFRETATSE